MIMLKPRPDNVTDFNPDHWAYTWGLDVAAGLTEGPGFPGKKTFDAFSTRDRWHYDLGLTGANSADDLDNAPDLASALADALSIIDYMRAGDGSLPLLSASKLERAREALAAHS